MNINEILTRVLVKFAYIAARCMLVKWLLTNMLCGSGKIEILSSCTKLVCCLARSLNARSLRQQKWWIFRISKLDRRLWSTYKYVKKYASSCIKDRPSATRKVSVYRQVQNAGCRMQIRILQVKNFAGWNFGLYLYVTRTNVSFVDPSPNLVFRSKNGTFVPVT